MLAPWREIMCLITDFKIGWLNAWLGCIPIILSMIIIFGPNKESLKRASDMSSYTIKEKIRALVSSFIFFGAMLYAVTLPLKLGTMWFYTGLVIYMLGLIPYIISMSNFVSTPLNAPVIKGVYKISRNPIYFFSALTLLGIGTAGGSGLMIIFVILYAILNHLTILAEEKFCSARFGESYYKYTKTVARYFLFF
jgi:protein-S-isoprenylcysteine O-methyltransferase Ste14